MVLRGSEKCVVVTVAPHKSKEALCSCCLKPAPGYDTLPQRSWHHVPLWGLKTVFLYPPRRVECLLDGVVVEHIPWSEGKRPITKPMMIFLAQWARRLSWKETAEVFKTSWEAVYRSVEWYVEGGLARRVLQGIKAIGIDEIHWGKGLKSANFLTVIYQIDQGCRRLLWVGPARTQRTLRKGLDELGTEVVAGLQFVCSDMWQPFLSVIKERIAHALNVLDRFHIVSHLNKAVDQVRRSECTRLKGSPKAVKLKHMRWSLLRRGTRVRGKARVKLDALVESKLASARAWMLKESFGHFWKYKSEIWAGAFLDVWTTKAMRSRLEPMKRVARMLRSHEELILNWFRAKGEHSSAAVEGLNNKVRVVTRRSYGFRTYRAMRIALYHNLGKLPEPEVSPGNTHCFC